VAADGIAYVAYFGANAGTGLWKWNTLDDTFQLNVSFVDHWVLSAVHFRADGSLVGTLYDDPRLHLIDLAAKTVTPIGAFGNGIEQIISLARETETGRTFLLAGELDGEALLYAADLLTLETTLIGTLPRELGINGIAGMAPCPADFNADGVLNILDFVALQLAWQAGDDAADVNGDGQLDVLDFVAFQDLFEEGCA
jgi:hypothetical protein